MKDIILDKFKTYPENIRFKMEYLRNIILEVAKNTPDVGDLEETLKWGELAYLTSKTKSGSTIRIDWKEKSPNIYAMYFNCQTTLISDYKSIFPELSYQGNRAIIFNVNETLPEEELKTCISMALRYHLDKKK